MQVSLCCRYLIQQRESVPSIKFTSSIRRSMDDGGRRTATLDQLFPIVQLRLHKNGSMIDGGKLGLGHDAFLAGSVGWWGDDYETSTSESGVPSPKGPRACQGGLVLTSSGIMLGPTSTACSSTRHPLRLRGDVVPFSSGVRGAWGRTIP